MKKNDLCIKWQGLTIDLEYTPDYSPAFKENYGWPLAHLSIKRRDKGQLPMTGTGYRSHFTAAANIEDHGGPEGFVRAWLEEGAKSEKWKGYINGYNGDLVPEKSLLTVPLKTELIVPLCILRTG